MDKLVASMAIALHNLDVPEWVKLSDLNYEQTLSLAQSFLHALADDLPDEMVERGLQAPVLDGCESTIDEYIGTIVGKSFLIAALKGASRG